MDPNDISPAFCVSVHTSLHICSPQCLQSAFRPVYGQKCGKRAMWSRAQTRWEKCREKLSPCILAASFK